MPNILDLREKYGKDMATTQCQHVESIIEEFAEAVYKKYAAGQAEHGGNLWEKSIVFNELVAETLDFVVYAFTARKQLKDAGIILGNPELKD